MTIPTPMRERCANAARKYLERCADLGTPISYADLTDAVLAELETPTEEQDAAARREGHAAGFAEARKMAKQDLIALAHAKKRGEDLHGAIAVWDCVAHVAALTPEPPSEKENEGG